ncbi:unnamed protein product [Acanthosepion pharaonis]|uniref:Uncharacterized protein n=1 Tax=Acanthosepion pharaonis TaxID=158019 RepID=A0A812B2K0_ACAPH|nr:unnamed protein product [Sepia pharaonis]
MYFSLLFPVFNSFFYHFFSFPFYLQSLSQLHFFSFSILFFLKKRFLCFFFCNFFFSFYNLFSFHVFAKFHLFFLFQSFLFHSKFFIFIFIIFFNFFSFLFPVFIFLFVNLFSFFPYFLFFFSNLFNYFIRLYSVSSSNSHFHLSLIFFSLPFSPLLFPRSHHHISAPPTLTFLQTNDIFYNQFSCRNNQSAFEISSLRSTNTSSNSVSPLPTSSHFFFFFCFLLSSSFHSKCRSFSSFFYHPVTNFETLLMPARRHLYAARQ